MNHDSSFFWQRKNQLAQCLQQNTSTAIAIGRITNYYYDLKALCPLPWSTMNVINIICINHKIAIERQTEFYYFFGIFEGCFFVRISRLSLKIQKFFWTVDLNKLSTTCQFYKWHLHHELLISRFREYNSTIEHNIATWQAWDKAQECENANMPPTVSQFSRAVVSRAQQLEAQTLDWHVLVKVDN